MSMVVITVADVKAYLRVIHSADDALLQNLVDSATSEALRFMDRERLPTLPVDYPPLYDSSSEPVSEEVPSSEDPIAPEVFDAVCLLVRASYEALTPEEVAGYRKAAEVKLMPFRARMGV